VVKKFGDDNGGVLVANLAFSGFVCLFPLLLLAVSLTDVVLSRDPGARHRVLDAVFGTFPAVGTQLRHSVTGIHRATFLGLVIGLAGLAWGSIRLAQTGQFTMSEIWTVPKPERPRYAARLERTALFLVVLALGVVCSAALATFGTFSSHDAALGAAAEVFALVVAVGVSLACFRVLTAKSVGSRLLVPGALVAGAGWTLLEAVGGYLVGHDLRDDRSLYGTFGVVLGLVAFVTLTATLTVYAAELNVVLARGLWPRSIFEPPLTDADRRALALTVQAAAGERPEEIVSVRLTEGDAPNVGAKDASREGIRTGSGPRGA
jgi:YihY family inner membrane protein